MKSGSNSYLNNFLLPEAVLVDTVHVCSKSVFSVGFSLPLANKAEFLHHTNSLVGRVNTSVNNWCLMSNSENKSSKKNLLKRKEEAMSSWTKHKKIGTDVKCLTNGFLFSVFQIRIHWVRIRHFRQNTDPDPGFDDQKFEKIWYFFDQKMQFTISRSP